MNQKPVSDSQLADKPTNRSTEKPTRKPANHPMDKPTDKSTNRPTDKPTDKLTSLPTEEPTDKLTNLSTDKPTNRPTDKSTDKPTNRSTEKPTNQSTSRQTEKPTKQSTPKPTDKLTSELVTAVLPNKPTIPSDYYKYTNGTTYCSGVRVENKINIDGPAPLDNKSDVAVQFFAYGDTPYDSHINTCIGDDGNKENDCTRFDCTASTSKLPSDNTCTYEGPEFACVRDSLIPFMNSKIDAGDAAFMAHTGDIISE